MKICSKCKLAKEFHEFNRNKSRADDCQSVCKICQAERDKKYYATSLVRKCKKKANSTYWRQRLRTWLWELKQGLCCKYCIENDPACLDFHHRDRSQKEFSIGNGNSKKKILAEIVKCDVICSNCHRKLHRYGALAHLGERLNGIEKVSGSSPLCSTVET